MRPENRSDRQAGRSRLFDVMGAAEYLGVTPRFMRRLVAERRIAFIKVGRHLRFDVDDLDRFITAGRVDVVNAPRLRPVGRGQSG